MIEVRSGVGDGDGQVFDIVGGVQSCPLIVRVLGVVEVLTINGEIVKESIITRQLLASDVYVIALLALQLPVARYKA